MKKQPTPAQSRTADAWQEGSFLWAERLLQTDKRLSGEQLALVLESNPTKPLTPALREYGRP